MKTIKVFDAAVFIVVLIIIGLFSYYAYSSPTDNAAVHIKTKKGEWIYPLSIEDTFHFEGPLGDTVIEIRNQSVQVLSSPCLEKICISSGPIDRPGSWLACLPNQIFIRIKGKSEDNIDAGTF